MEAGREPSKLEQPHLAAFTMFWIGMVLSTWECQLEAQCFTYYPHLPMPRDSCRQRRSLFLPTSFVSPARIIILHLWHHHELWGRGEGLGCHKQRILSQTGDPGSRVAREKKSKDCLSRQSFCLCVSQKRQEAELLSKHIHTKTKLTNHTTKTPWLLKPMDRRGMLIS